ncbi:MAG: cell division protein ZipA [Granulosicoccus sp.]|nr:cell division protein ZipA [Granulosicoccus sp.]
MDNLRWILILAGVAILVLLYLSGRSRRTMHRHKTTRASRRSAAATNHLDPLLGDEPMPEREYAFDDIQLDDMARPGDPGRTLERADHGNYEFETDLGRSNISSPGFTSLAQKIESISERLSPKRRQRVAESVPADMDEESTTDPAFANKIVSLHVVAQSNAYIEGEQLLELFERRGYHFGEMNIFHSMHNDQTVFSIAKMIEPGYFDIDDVDTFATPGITLILQLPGPVPADVAFEVLISEAFEMASELNATVLDGDRNNMSKQTLQHMREGIYEYMHRQKYFGSVPS